MKLTRILSLRRAAAVAAAIKENKKALQVLIGMRPYQNDGVPNFAKIAKESGTRKELNLNFLIKFFSEV